MTLEVEVDVFPSVSSYVPEVSSGVPGRSVTPTTNAGSSDSPASSMPDLVTTKITSLKQKGNKAVIKWKRKSKVSGYQIQYSKTKKFKKKKTITVKKASTAKSLSGLKKARNTISVSVLSGKRKVRSSTPSGARSTRLE